MKNKWLIGGVILVLVAIFFVICTYTVKEDQYCIVTSFGKPGAIKTDPGLYFKLPKPISIMNKMDKRIQIYQTSLIEYLTGDKKNLILQTFICWKIENPLLYFQATNNDVKDAEIKLDDVVCSLVGATLGDHQMNDIIKIESEGSVLEEIAYNIQREAKIRAKGYGIDLVHVGFSRLALPDDNAQSVYRRMKAERSAIANEYRAKGRQHATEIQAEAERQKREIIAEAEKQAEIIRGEGNAMAAEIYGDAYSKAPEFFKFIKTLEADEKIFKDKTTVVISSDSQLFEILKPEK